MDFQELNAALDAPRETLCTLPLDGRLDALTRGQRAMQAPESTPLERAPVGILCKLRRGNCEILKIKPNFGEILRIKTRL